MKKFCIIALAAILACTALTKSIGALAPDDIISEAAVLMDLDTGQVLYAKNMEQRMYPASTTKIMTALLTVENARPYEVTTVTSSALDIDEPDSSNIALVTGEKLPVESALYALMLPSANDAANVLAEHVAGSQQEFAQMMTQRAHEIGAVNTQFTNAHGLHEDSHYTTAYDLALITRHAMGNKEFAGYFGTSHYTMAATNLQEEERPFTNYQYMLVSSTNFYYEDVIGGKTGYTDEARHTMSTVATRDGRTLVCVVMSSPYRYDKFKDTKALLDYGFEEFYPHTVSGDDFPELNVPIGSENNVIGNANFLYDTDVTLYLPNEAKAESLQFRVNPPSYFDELDEVSCSISFSLAQQVDGIPDVLLSIPMNSTINIDAVPVSMVSVTESTAWSRVKNRLLSSSFSLMLLVLLVLSGILMLMLAMRQRTLYKRRRQRMARRNRAYHSAAVQARPQPPARRNNVYQSTRRSRY